MSFIRILLVGAAILPLLQAQSPLTLDPSMIEEAKRAAFRQSGVLMPEPETSAVQGDSARWQAAMDAAGTELMPVMLLGLLQRLNPHLPMEEHAALYAEALRLHVQAAGGDKAARMELTAALRVGALLNGLRVPCDASLAEKWN